jgi:tRNA G18 (ribose-2'-O)-methylase SpoU
MSSPPPDASDPDAADGTRSADPSGAGVGPHAFPWPVDDRLDPELLAAGDHRNVADRYRYWSVDAIVADLDTRRRPVHVAIENWEHDFNIGTVIRNANAFNVAGVHVVGGKRWDRRGAMSTHRYLHLHHHPDISGFAAWSAAAGVPIVAIENSVDAAPIETASLPSACALLFGQEGPGLSTAALEAAAMVCAITQYGSTRSLNAGVASGIALFAWSQQHPLGT